MHLLINHYVFIAMAPYINITCLGFHQKLMISLSIKIPPHTYTSCTQIICLFEFPPISYSLIRIEFSEKNGDLKLYGVNLTHIIFLFGSMERILERYERYSYAESQILTNDAQANV